MVAFLVAVVVVCGVLSWSRRRFVVVVVVVDVGVVS